MKLNLSEFQSLRIISAQRLKLNPPNANSISPGTYCVNFLKCVRRTKVAKKSKFKVKMNIQNTQDNIVQDEGIEDVGEEEVVRVVTTAKMIIDAVVDVAQVTTTIADIPVSAAETIVTTAPTITAESTKTNVEVIQAPKRKGVMIQEPEETTTTKTASSQQPQVQDKDKGKAKLNEKPEMPKKRKHQIRANKELAEKLQAEMQAEIDEEDRLAREREIKEQEANDALINTWDDIQSKIDAND
uniref:Uncharacterized protein n=1 Tax=Tanacetum cinerariifolium TaxID=118510 RepID=A0A699I8I3_TANCI|nr:hypothetical protein [Tanacetum cinerariifolium]